MDRVSVRTALDSRPALIVTAGTRSCAIPLCHVAETMRPLPVEPLTGMPEFVRGVSVIRGAAVPVVDLAALLENGRPGATCGRFVTLKLGERRVAIAVDTVVGARDLQPAELGELPPILRDASAGLIEMIGTRDAQLLVVLRASCIVPDEVPAPVRESER
jgi:purine-binding chemotaxis protein CheW